MSSLLLIIPYIYLPDTVFFSYRYALLLLCPVSFLNHWDAYNPEKLPHNLIIRKLDHCLILYLCSVALTRSSLLSLVFVAINLKFELRYYLFIINFAYQIYVSKHVPQMLISLFLCTTGFRYNSNKK